MLRLRRRFCSVEGGCCGAFAVLVSHRAWTLRGVDSVVVLDGGCVEEQGTYRSY